MSKTIIKIEDLSKQYRLGTIGTGTIANDLNRWWQTKILHKEDPYLKVGETNDRAHKGLSEYVWALKDINLEVKEGDVVGIIGKNGAGKSTLLKILSRVTAPTTGRIIVNGRLASLLEVGTGFHPELTGRENIFLNGAILGMTKAEIRSKLDEIIDFSGCERYIDTPVKRYSSGMNVRLGFAVAAFLEPEILIVDEVLAVGDAEFQKKAIGKMQDVSTNHGRTVLFVSHNMASIRSLCKKGIVIHDGQISLKGNIDEVINEYLNNNVILENQSKFLAHKQNVKPYINIDKFTINQLYSNPIILNKGNNIMEFDIYGYLKIEKHIAFEFRLYDQNQIPLLLHSPSHHEGKVELYKKGMFHINHIVKLPKEINKGEFIASIYLTEPGIESHVTFDFAVQINIEGYTMKTGHTFDYQKGAGFLFLP